MAKFFILLGLVAAFAAVSAQTERVKVERGGLSVDNVQGTNRPPGGDDEFRWHFGPLNGRSSPWREWWHRGWRGPHGYHRGWPGHYRDWPYWRGSADGDTSLNSQNQRLTDSLRASRGRSPWGPGPGPWGRGPGPWGRGPGPWGPGPGPWGRGPGPWGGGPGRWGGGPGRWGGGPGRWGGGPGRWGGGPGPWAYGQGPWDQGQDLDTDSRNAYDTERRDEVEDQELGFVALDTQSDGPQGNRMSGIHGRRNHRKGSRSTDATRNMGHHTGHHMEPDNRRPEHPRGSG